jgi:farnesyl-diphosphate farnesyltransferase
MSPSEVDSPEDVANGTVLGVKRAAVRKLQQELGVAPSHAPLAKFKFLTRLHYFAAAPAPPSASAGAAAAAPKWGEHEIDYILFLQPDEPVPLRPNPDEVSDTRYVSPSELRAMMAPEAGLQWSPWFRVIAERFLVHWWAELKTTLHTYKFVDTVKIYSFEPPPLLPPAKAQANAEANANAQGKGEAAAALQAGSTGLALQFGAGGKKQGGYGKIRTHSESLCSQLLRGKEVAAMARWLTTGKRQYRVSRDLGSHAGVRECDDFLGKVSRSFALVIRQLPDALYRSVMAFYLVLRALDTIEDDMTAFATQAEKISHVRGFAAAALSPSAPFSLSGVGQGDEARLLQRFACVQALYRGLSAGAQGVVADITRRMADGMAEFASKDLRQGTAGLDEYNLYCHYVAGLVGHGLSRLFVCEGFEEERVAHSLDIANDMGLFL